MTTQTLTKHNVLIKIGYLVCISLSKFRCSNSEQCCFLFLLNHFTRGMFLACESDPISPMSPIYPIYPIYPSSPSLPEAPSYFMQGVSVVFIAGRIRIYFHRLPTVGGRYSVREI